MLPVLDPSTSIPLDPSALPATTVEALYVHIPFCFHKCHYCDFYSITRQTPERMTRFVDLVLREGRAAVLAFNKWDLIEDPQAVLADLREKTDRLLPQARGIRAVPISGQTGRGLDKLMQSIIDTDRVWNRRISTARLNRWLEAQQVQHPPPAVSGRRLKLKYMTQVKARPPGFMVSCTRPEALPESYVRYLTNGLRNDFDLPGVPIRIHFRASDNPYAGKAKKKR